MSEKFYETCAKQVVMLIQQHKEDAKKVADAVQKLNTDRRYSDYGKEQLMKGLLDELNVVNEKKNNELRDVVKQFVQQYQIIREDDGKADPQSVANALKVIDMCGTSLTADVLRTAVEPIRGSYTTLKMIHSVLLSKNENSPSTEACYKDECLHLLENYIGENATIISYEETLSAVKDALEMPFIVRIGLHSEPDYNGTVVNRLLDNTPYTTFCIADNMMRVGKMYDQVSMEYPGLFK